MIWFVVVQGIVNIVLLVFVLMFRVIVRDLLKNIEVVNKQYTQMRELEGEVLALRKMVTGK